MPDSSPPLLLCLKVVALSAAMKLLLFPFYHSTDFEVHRNWLAITHSLPLHKWYREDTSQWTLDYPPFFAYFELFLANFAGAFDPAMLQVHNLNYDSWMTVCFQRSSVLVSESILFVATFRYLSSSSVQMGGPLRCKRDNLVIFILVAFNAGLIIVDNIHFQYNGMMLGLIILCGDFANRKSYRSLAITFSILVLLKHLFAPLAPIVGAYLLKAYCLECDRCNESKSLLRRFRVWNFFQLVLIALFAISLAFLPFIVIVAPASNPAGSIAESLKSLELLIFDMPEQIRQIFSRLFPFGRGLVHAYWAPNVWALYIIFDKILKIVSGKAASCGLKSQSLALSLFSFVLCPSSDIEGNANSSTSGLVGDFHFSCLPLVQPTTSMLLVVLMLVPAIFKIFNQSHCERAMAATGSTPSSSLRSCESLLPAGLFLKTVVYGAMTLFMFGYHVHEKAILVTLLPMTMLLFPSSLSGQCPGFRSSRERELWHAAYMQITAGGITALLPLLMNVDELLLKGAICFSFLVVVHILISPASGPGFTRLNQATVVVLLLLFIFNEIIHPMKFWSAKLNSIRYPFLPLLLYSSCCAVILCHAYFLMILALFDFDKLLAGSSYEGTDDASSRGTVWDILSSFRSIKSVFSSQPAGKHKFENIRKPPTFRSLPPRDGNEALVEMNRNNRPAASKPRTARSNSVSSSASQASRGSKSNNSSGKRKT